MKVSPQELCYRHVQTNQPTAVGKLLFRQNSVEILPMGNATLLQLAALKEMF